MITTSPLPSKMWDSGDTGDARVQGAGIRPFSAVPSVPHSAADGGQKWVQSRPRARS